MKNLFKYEFRKTLPTKLIILGITAIAQLVFLVGLWQESDKTVAIGVALLVLIATFGIMVIGLQSVLTLHRDMNTKQSYMLFMTPNSCYKILGAKMLENLLSMTIGGLFFFGLGTLDIALLFNEYVRIDDLLEGLQDILMVFGYDINIDAGYMACFTFGMLSGWFSVVTTAFFADVVSSALLNGKKYNLLLSFVFFLILSYLVGQVGSAIAGDALTRTEQVVGTTMDSMGNVVYTSSIEIRSTSPYYFLKSGAVSLVLSGLFYVATAELMQRKLSV